MIKILPQMLYYKSSYVLSLPQQDIHVSIYTNSIYLSQHTSLSLVIIVFIIQDIFTFVPTSHQNKLLFDITIFLLKQLKYSSPIKLSCHIRDHLLQKFWSKRKKLN